MFPDESEIENYVTGLFRSNPQGFLPFHNFSHTKDVVRRAREILAAYNIGGIEYAIVCAAAWFHDTGYLFVKPEVHERCGADIMIDFFATRGISPDQYAPISNAIMATKYPPRPMNLVEQIVCDADTYHLGTEEFYDSNNLVFEEFCLTNKSLTREIFEEGTLLMLTAHRFHTGYCIDNLTGGKEKNILNLKKENNL